jgi:hypothetical protein
MRQHFCVFGSSVSFLPCAIIVAAIASGVSAPPAAIARSAVLAPFSPDERQTKQQLSGRDFRADVLRTELVTAMEQIRPGQLGAGITCANLIAQLRDDQADQDMLELGLAEIKPLPPEKLQEFQELAQANCLLDFEFDFHKLVIDNPARLSTPVV